MRITQDAKIARVVDSAAAGQGSTNGSSVSMVGFDSVTFIAAIGSVAAGGSVELKAQGSSDDGDSDAFADLEGTAVQLGADDDNGLLVLEINKPRELHVRPVLTRSDADAAIDGVIALQTAAQKVPVEHDSSVIASELHLAPAEGTA